MRKRIDKEFEIPQLNMSDEKVKEVMRITETPKPFAAKKKIVPVHFEGEEVELFMKSYKASPSKHEKDFAKDIILNHLKNGG